MKYLSLFSGIGGFEYGLEQSDYEFECVGFSEIDDYAKSIYIRHFPKHKDLGDASEIDPTEIEDFELLVGGFPCQAFSIAGKRGGFDDTRGTLFFEIARILEAKRPKYFLLENVKGLLSHDGSRTFKKMLGILAELGYDVEWSIYNSKSFSVPQNRERVYLKGYFRRKCGGEILSQKRDSRKTDGAVNTTKIEKVGNLSNTNHGGKNVYSKDGLSPTLCSESIPKNGVNIVENTLKPVHFDRQVQKRVHTVDYDELSDYLRSHKKAANATVNDISQKLGVKKSEVDHWFRRDDYFAPPPPHIWYRLKDVLDINDDRYDAFITEFEWVDGVYEMDKRAYESDGISPTLNTKCDGLIKVVGNLSKTGHGGENVVGVDGISSTLTTTNYKHPLKILETKTLKLKTNTVKGYDEVTTGDGVRLCHPSSTKARGRTQKGQTGALSTSADWGTVDRDYRIRKLTPLECERLQAFPNYWTKYGKDDELISDTQRYKCLGNAVTTTVVTYIANHMFGDDDGESS